MSQPQVPRPNGLASRRRYHGAIGWIRSLPWLRIVRVLFALYLVGALISVLLPGDWRQADVTLYRNYAAAFWDHLGHPTLPAEYPPLSVVPFALALVGPPAVGQDSFAAGMAVLFVLGFFAVRRWKGSSRAWTYGFYTLAAGPATLLFRYDLVAALLVLACLWLLERRRFGSLYPLIGVGTLVKVFPLVLLPVAAIAHARAGWRRGPRGVAWRLAAGGAACLGIVVAGFALGLVVDPGHGLGALTYEFQRPVEVESVPATLMWLGSLVGVPIHPADTFGGYDLTGPLSGLATALGDAALVAGMLWVWWRQATGRMDAGHAFTATVLVLLCTSRVLSAQYLLWVAPLLAVVDGFRFRWLAVFLLTAAVFPLLFTFAVQYQPRIVYSGLFLLTVGARNVLMVVCTALYLASPQTSTSRLDNPEPPAAHPEPAVPVAATLAAGG